MDDELLFVLSGLAPNKSSLKTAEESCRNLVMELSSSNASWLRIILNDQKQKILTLSGATFLLEQETTSRRGLHAALALLIMILSAAPNDSLASPQETDIVKRLALAVTKELFALQTDEGAKDDVFDFLNKRKGSSQPTRKSDVAAQVLVTLTSSKFASSANVVRTEINRLGMHHFVVDYVKNVFANARAHEDVKISTLNLVENLCVASKENAFEFSKELVPLSCQIIANSSSKIREASLKALMNMTNGVVQAGVMAAQKCNAVDVLCKALRSYVPQTILTEDSLDLSACLNASTFDGVLICLSAIGNLVELSETGATSRFSPDHLALICAVYTKSLPIRARASLQERSATETVEAEWTPESLILAAHACLVLGCICRDSRECADVVLKNVPAGQSRGFSPMVQVLDTFLSFQSDAGVLSTEGEQVIRQVAGYLNDANNRTMLPPSSLMSADQLARRKRQQVSSSMASNKLS